MQDGSRTGRYGALLALLLAFLLVGPPLAAAGHGTAAMAVSFPALVALCALAVRDVRRMRALVLSLAGLAIAGDLALHAQPPPAVLVAGVRCLFAGVLAIVAGVIVARILRETRVSAHTLLGGIAAYLLLGMLFGSLYSALETLRPGSFASGGVPVGELPGAHPEMGRFPQLFYFSFVTLTTLGYGDVVPAAPPAPMLAVIEAVAGQLYLAILVAGLVGMHLAHRQHGDG